MRIWLVNHYARPRGQFGIPRTGIQAHYLSAAGHEVTVLTAAYSHRHYPVVQVPTKKHFTETPEGLVNFRYLKTREFASSVGRLRNMFSFAGSLPKGIDGLARPDIIMGSTPHPYGCAAAMKLARRFNVPYVHEVRDVWPDSLVEMKAMSRWHPVALHLAWNERRILRGADAIVGVLPGIERLARQAGHASDRYIELPNGADPAAQLPITELPVTELSGSEPGSIHTGEQEFVVSYVGVLGSANAVDTIIEAAALLNRHPQGQRVRFQIVGGGPQEASLQALAKTHGATNVQFIGAVPKHEVPAILAGSHTLVTSLRRSLAFEKYGLSLNKLFDYMLAARPIVLAGSALNNPLASANAGITVAPENPAAIAEAILKLREIPPRQRQIMGERGRSYVLEHHNHRMLAERLGTFFASLVGSQIIRQSVAA